MMQTIPHILRMCNYPFSHRVLAIDATAPTGDYAARPHIGTVTELRQCCDGLLASKTVDRVVNVDFSRTYVERAYTKHLGRYIPRTHNFRGAPILSYIYLLEEAESDYVVHFNTDMLIHQSTKCNWIEEGITRLKQHPEIACITPLSGPPADDGVLQQNVAYQRDPKGLYRFKQFTSRKFLVDRRRFEELLPLKILWKDEGKLKETADWEQCRQLDRWEEMVSLKLRSTHYVRADLDLPGTWAIHSSYTHDEQFIRHLPAIINKIESGWYPYEQAGAYNLDLQLWLRSMT